jgi:hypothetical protein
MRESPTSCVCGHITFLYAKSIKKLKVQQGREIKYADKKEVDELDKDLWDALKQAQRDHLCARICQTTDPIALFSIEILECSECHQLV